MLQWAWLSFRRLRCPKRHWHWFAKVRFVLSALPIALSNIILTLNASWCWWDITLPYMSTIIHLRLAVWTEKPLDYCCLLNLRLPNLVNWIGNSAQVFQLCFPSNTCVQIESRRIQFDNGNWKRKLDRGLAKIMMLFHIIPNTTT